MLSLTVLFFRLVVMCAHVSFGELVMVDRPVLRFNQKGEFKILQVID